MISAQKQDAEIEQQRCGFLRDSRDTLLDNVVASVRVRVRICVSEGEGEEREEGFFVRNAFGVARTRTYAHKRTFLKGSYVLLPVSSSTQESKRRCFAFFGGADSKSGGWIET